MLLAILLAFGAALLSLPTSIALALMGKLAWSSLLVCSINAAVAAFAAILAIGILWLPLQEVPVIGALVAAIAIIVQIAIWIGMPIMTSHYGSKVIWQWTG